MPRADPPGPFARGPPSNGLGRRTWSWPGGVRHRRRRVRQRDVRRGTDRICTRMKCSVSCVIACAAMASSKSREGLSATGRFTRSTCRPESRAWVFSQSRDWRRLELYWPQFWSPRPLNVAGSRLAPRPLTARPIRSDWPRLFALLCCITHVCRSGLGCEALLGDSWSGHRIPDNQRGRKLIWAVRVAERRASRLASTLLTVRHAASIERFVRPRRGA